MPVKTSAAPATTSSADEAKAVDKPYSVYKVYSGPLQAVADGLREQFDGQDHVTVHVIVSSIYARGPKEAIKAAAEDHVIEGDYEVVATKNRTIFPGLGRKIVERITGL